MPVRATPVQSYRIATGTTHKRQNGMDFAERVASKHAMGAPVERWS